MNIQGFFIPDNWEPNNKKAINQWMKKLPTVYDLAAAEKADETYRELMLINSLRK